MAVAAVLGVTVIAALARPVLHAVSVVLEVTVIAAASALGLAAMGGIAFLALRAHRRHARTLSAPLPRPAAEAVSAPQRLAIEAPRPSLADVKALAAEHGYDVVLRQDAQD